MEEIAKTAAELMLGRLKNEKNGKQQEKKQEWLDFTQQINRLISDETI